MKNIGKYKKIYLSIFDSNNIEQFKYGDNGWDSAGHLILITEIEKEFDIHLEIEEILKFKSFNEGIEILKKHNIKF